MVPHDRFTDLRRPPSAIARSSTIEHDIMRRVREWMAGGPPPHGLPSLRQPPTARAVEDCLDETAVLMDQSPDPRGASSQRDDGSPRPPRALPPGHTARPLPRYPNRTTPPPTPPP